MEYVALGCRTSPWPSPGFCSHLGSKWKLPLSYLSVFVFLLFKQNEKKSNNFLMKEILSLFLSLNSYTLLFRLCLFLNIFVFKIVQPSFCINLRRLRRVLVAGCVFILVALTNVLLCPHYSLLLLHCGTAMHPNMPHTQGSQLGWVDFELFRELLCLFDKHLPTGEETKASQVIYPRSYANELLSPRGHGTQPTGGLWVPPGPG